VSPVLPFAFPLDEFYLRAGITLPRIERIDGESVPEPYKSLLVHSQDIPKFMTYRTREFPKLFAGGAYPPNTLLMIDRLVKEEFLIEVSAVAAL
jgi:hypothetical protein